MELVAVGVDPRSAALAVRERLSVTAEATLPLLRALAAERWVGEALLLSTCNRTEAYVVTPEPEAPAHLLAALRRLVPDAPEEAEGCYVRRVGEDAARHLLRVAAGLESSVLGETEVQGQVREALALGREAGTVGPFLDRLGRGALHAGKRVRTETAISRGAVSHGHAAYEIARQVFGDLRHRTVLVVGAGEMARGAATAVAALPGGRFVVANRTRANAERLAADLPSAEIVDLDAVSREAERAHVVIVATSGEPVGDGLRAGLARRRDPLLVLDYGVPRGVDPSLRDEPGVFLYDLEAVEAVLSRSLAARREAVPAAEAIVETQMDELRAWHRSLRAVPAIRSLAAWAEEVRRAEVARLPADAPAAVRDAVDEATRRLVERIVRRPAARVRRGTEASDPSMPTPEHLRAVFGLDEPNASKALDGLEDDPTEELA